MNEEKTKCYEFEAWASVKINGYVYAEDEEQAKKLINNFQYDDSEEEKKLEEIVEIGEVIKDECDN